MEKKFVTYEEFGAVGDGKTDDMPALVKTHEYANEHNLPVHARKGAQYYIGGKALTMVIKTSCNFYDAEFIIDDVNLEDINKNLIIVATSAQQFVPEITSLKKGQKKVDFPHEGNVYVRAFTNSHKVYIRKGLNMNSGIDPSDCFIVDKDGNILNDINWDYPSFSKIYARSVDEEPITIDGGKFITIANQAESKYNYHHRNIMVRRSNVTIRNLNYYVVGEGDHGAPYAGFICAEETNNFLLENCTLCPHKTYYTESKIPGQMVGMGTYGLSVRASTFARLIGVKQFHSIHAAPYWGLMGSNFSKDMLLENCEISRFDAHCGVTNATLRNCHFGKSGILIIGFGEFTIESCTVSSFVFASFRPDYGSFFDGKLVIKDCVWNTKDEPYYLLAAQNKGDHDFGYKCMLPQEIIIDGLTINDEKSTREEPIAIMPDYDDEYTDGKPFAYQPTKKLVLKNISVASGKDYIVMHKPDQYKDMDIVIE